MLVEFPNRARAGDYEPERTSGEDVAVGQCGFSGPKESTAESSIAPLDSKRWTGISRRQTDRYGHSVLTRECVGRGLHFAAGGICKSGSSRK